MAEQITLKKRLIGKEDINFDITGTGEQEFFFTVDGFRKNVSKINASHLPLTTKTREKLNVINVDEAIAALSEKNGGSISNDAQAEDIEIIFENTDDFETIQNKINQQKKNLGGHTLKFMFPASLTQNLYSTLVWQDFYNGTLVISGGSENSPVAVYDRQDINALFRVYRCQCEVRISNFYFVHKNSMYGIAVESSSATVIRDCNFSGITDADSYAVYSLVSNVSLTNCQFTDENDPEKDDNDVSPTITGMGKSIGEIFAYPSIIPPDGAYLLNGQTIGNCETLYPEFWKWLTENSGEMVETPVYKPWTMPALTADGTIGGDEYAVQASSTAASGYDAYKSFDGTRGGARTFAAMNGVKTGWYTWYSPVTLKVSRIVFQNATAVTAAELVKEFEIFGSNDNQTWHSLTTGTVASTAASAIQIEDIPESKYGADNPGYKYFKFEVVNGGGGDIEFPEITIYGEEYLYTDYHGNGNILTLTRDAYEYILSRTGVCGGFVIDGRAGSVRLPTLINGTVWGADSSNIGQSLAAGLPNITATFAIDNETWIGGSVYARGQDKKGAEGGDGEQHEAIFDASLSNSIYGNSDTVQPPAIRLAWCIQVFAAAAGTGGTSGGGGGSDSAVISVNGKVGNVTITAADLGVYTKSEVDDKLANFTPSGGDKVISVNGKIGEITLTAEDVGAMPRTEAEGINQQMKSDITALMGALDAMLGLNVTTLVVYLEQDGYIAFKCLFSDESTASGYASVQEANTGEYAEIKLQSDLTEYSFPGLKAGIYYLTLGGNYNSVGFNLTDSTDTKVWQVYGMSVYLTDCGSAFKDCKNLTTLNGVGLPVSLELADSMFEGCENLELSLDDLAALAPDGGYPITSAIRMFKDCTKVIGSRSAFLAVCPNLTEENRIGMFNGTNTTP